MNGVAATLNQGEDTIEPPLATGNAEGGTRLETEVTQPDDVSQIGTTEADIIRNIQEDSVRLEGRNWHWAVRPRLFLGSEVPRLCLESPRSITMTTVQGTAWFTVTAHKAEKGVLTP